MEIDGLQTSVQTGINNPGARDFLPIDGNDIEGIEIDLSLLLADGLTLDLGYGYLDTALGASEVTSPAGTFALVDVMSYAPENSFTAALDYQRDMSNGQLGFNLSYSYQDEFSGSVNAADDVMQDSYGLFDAALSWSNIKLASVSGSFKVLLWGKNLADEEYTVLGGGAWSTFGAGEVFTFGERRTYGLTVTYFYD